MTSPRVWLITGASTGFGRLLTEFVLSQGDAVVATLRKPEVLQQLSEKYKDKLLAIKVDVTNQADIDHAFAKTKEVFGKLDVVFNNAGLGILGDAESTPSDKARGLFDVNFWGAVNVSVAAVKFFRDVNEPGRGGILLQNSSTLGYQSAPGVAFYCASKRALDGFSESLDKEMLPQWNIKISIIHPGCFHTNVLSNATVLPVNPVYEDEKSGVAALRNEWCSPGYTFPGDATKFVKTIYALVQEGNIPLYVPLGQDALARAEKQIELVKKNISESSRWSADLLRDDIVETASYL